MRAKTVVGVIAGNRGRIIAAGPVLQLADAGNKKIQRERGGAGVLERIGAGQRSDGAHDQQFVCPRSYGRHRKCTCRGRR